MSFFGGEWQGICRWSLVTGDIAERDVDAFVAHVESIAHATKPGYVVLDIAHGISMPTPVQRERVTNAVQAATRATRVLTAHALATNSVAARGVLTAINWFIQRNFEERVLATPRDALDWLATQSEKLDPDAVLADIAKAAPRFSLLRW